MLRMLWFLFKFLKKLDCVYNLYFLQLRTMIFFFVEEHQKIIKCDG